MICILLSTQIDEYRDFKVLEEDDEVRLRCVLIWGEYARSLLSSWSPFQLKFKRKYVGDVVVTATTHSSGLYTLEKSVEQCRVANI
jgi:hypothetical protein